VYSYVYSYVKIAFMELAGATDSNFSAVYALQAEEQLFWFSLTPCANDVVSEEGE
jgi:hypothetical protein